jgi:hypothetical protein
MQVLGGASGARGGGTRMDLLDVEGTDLYSRCQLECGEISQATFTNRERGRVELSEGP